jgi:putative flippase GtrA
VVDFCVYFFLTRLFGINYLLANALAFLSAATNSYFLNKFFTFRINLSANWQQYLRFIFFNLVTLAVIEFLMYVGVAHLFVADWQIKIFLALLSGVLNFSFSKFLVFGSK